MRVFQVPPFLGAILLSALCMGLIGVLVVLPVACIQWTWNSCVVGFAQLPHISVWQASLLYLALATVLYLTGVVHIEIEANKAE